jgi:hypothetical protein
MVQMVEGGRRKYSNGMMMLRERERERVRVRKVNAYAQ